MPNPLYNYGLPTTVTGTGGSPATTTGEVENGGSNGSSPATPPANSGTVFVPGGAPSDELVGMYTPTLASISPATVLHGAANATVTCTGTNFVAATPTRGGTVARVNGVDQVTTFVSPTSVTYVGQHLTAPAGTVPVTVANLGLETASKPFVYT